MKLLGATFLLSTSSIVSYCDAEGPQTCQTPLLFSCDSDAFDFDGKVVDISCGGGACVALKKGNIAVVWGNPSSGGGSHDLHIIFPYLNIVKQIVNKLNCKIIVDLGCGDLNIGKNFLDICDHYIACDISTHIINLNKKKSLIKN